MNDSQTTWRIAKLAVLVLALVSATGLPAARGQLLEGEFGDIDLGRPLVEPKRFPTLKELRAAVRQSEIRSVFMFKLYGDTNNHYLPVWSADGLRLAFQRSNVQERSSKLLAYPWLSQAQPLNLSDQESAYDYMFRWGQNSAGGYAFVRIDSETAGVHVLFSAGEEAPAPKTSGGGRHASPSLYQRTDGIWRLAYERDGQLMHEAFRGDGAVEAPLPLGRGAAPRWSSDGYRLLFARGRGNQLGAYDIAVLNLKTEKESLISNSPVVRSPTWSPGEDLAAYYAKEAGDNKPWRIEVASIAGSGKPRVVASDVVVNANFETEGPSWEPSGRRIWYFSHRRRQQAYYPLVAADVAGGEELVVDYPSRVTTPNDLAVNPMTEVPEMVFVAHQDLPQDVFVLFLNHY